MAQAGEHALIQVVPDPGPVGAQSRCREAVLLPGELSQGRTVCRDRVTSCQEESVQILGFRPAGGVIGDQPQGIHERQAGPVGPLGAQIKVYLVGLPRPAQGHVSDEESRIRVAIVRTGTDCRPARSQRIDLALIEINPGRPDTEAHLQQDPEKTPRRSRCRGESDSSSIELHEWTPGSQNDALDWTGASDAQSPKRSVLARVAGKLYAGAGGDVELPHRQAAIEIGRCSVHDDQPVRTRSFQYRPVDRITVTVVNVPETKHHSPRV